VTPRDTGPWTDHCREEKLISCFSLLGTILFLPELHIPTNTRARDSVSDGYGERGVRRTWRRGVKTNAMTTWRRADMTTRCQTDLMTTWRRTEMTEMMS
jgi:hypothetical protein